MSQDQPPKDHAEGMHEDEPPSRIEEHLKSKSTWVRFLFMVVMVLLYAVTRVVTAAVIILQFLHVLFTGAANDRLKQLGEQLARYTYQIILYLTFNTDDRPFPFDLDWPTARGAE